MKYIYHINSAFNELGFKSRGNQNQIINDILMQFIDNNCSTVVLNADTGVGKSIIGAVVAKVLIKLCGFDMQYFNGSITAVHTNALVDQYQESLPDALIIKGANNYECCTLSAHADECVTKGSPIFLSCAGCQYARIKEQRVTHDNIITNYTWLFRIILFTKLLQPRLVHIFDEGHLINDVWCSFGTIDITETYLTNLIKRIQRIPEISNHAKSIVRLKHMVADDKTDAMSALSVYSFSLIKMLQSLEPMLNNIKAKLNEKLAYNDDITKLQAKHHRITKFMSSLRDSITSLSMLNSNREMSYGRVDNGFLIEPIFIADDYNRIEAKYNLIMSATVSPDLVKRSFRSKRKIGYIKADMAFKPEQKQVCFLSNITLNYRVLQRPGTIDELARSINRICDYFKHERGLIMVPSFSLSEQIVERIAEHYASIGKLFVHESGTKVSEIIAQFKQHQGPALLISPSIFEGVDFPDDTSRYQILVKAPFPSLGNPRIKYISDHYPDVYRAVTIQTIVQSFGRSTRNPKDYSITFCLDRSIETLFYDVSNIWKNQFDIQ